MKKTLTTNGNSWQLYINKPIADLLGINKNEYVVNLKIERNILYVSKCINPDAEGAHLTKKLIKRGSGFGLNFPVPVLELLEIIPEEDLLDINLQEDKLIIKKL